jgi:hypothetical protein
MATMASSFIIRKLQGADGKALDAVLSKRDQYLP